MESVYGIGKEALLKFVRRIGLSPHADGRRSSNNTGCPDIWELDDGRFAVIGLDRTADLRAVLPADASCGPDERIVVIDRHVLVDARDAIPGK